MVESQIQRSVVTDSQHLYFIGECAHPDDTEEQLRVYMQLDQAERNEDLYFPLNRTTSQKLLNSQAMRLVFLYLDQAQVLDLQQLNKFMYRKMQHLHPIVLGDRIENCILVYSDYGNKDGAISVIVGKPKSDPNLDSEQRAKKMVEDFQARHPKFN